MSLHYTLSPRQDDCHFAEILIFIFLHENCYILIKFSLKFIPWGWKKNEPVLVQIMAWHSAVGWFHLKTTSYQYRKSHCGDKTILWSSYLHNGISYTGKMTSLYWIGAQVTKLVPEPMMGLVYWGTNVDLASMSQRLVNLFFFDGNNICLYSVNVMKQTIWNVNWNFSFTKFLRYPQLFHLKIMEFSGLLYFLTEILISIMLQYI